MSQAKSIRNKQNVNRLLSKLAYADEVQDVSGAEQLSVHEVLEGASTGTTKQFVAEVEFRKKSNRPSSQEQCLLVDLSNSTSKFALSTSRRLLSIRHAPTASLSKAILAELVAGWEIQRVIIASVVPKATKTITSFFKAAGIPLLPVTATTDLGITLRYPEPKSIGADRLVNVVAATKLYSTPCIVVDFGTAITFDIIDAQGAYLGGIIAPGLTTAAKALHQHTAQLPQAVPSSIRRALGKNTIAAIHSGLLLGARGLVREVVERITEENFSGQRPTVIATGGDARLVAGKTKLFDEVNVTLTLEGLREIGCRTR